MSVLENKTHVSYIDSRGFGSSEAYHNASLLVRERGVVLQLLAGRCGTTQHR